MASWGGEGASEKVTDTTMFQNRFFAGGLSLLLEPLQIRKRLGSEAQAILYRVFLVDRNGIRLRFRRGRPINSGVKWTVEPSDVGVF